MTDETTRGSYSQPGPPAPAAIRATDRDRDLAIGVLQESYSEGRLTKAEHDARVGRALTARTYADLGLLTADLPGRPGYVDAPDILQRRHTNGLAVAALICGVAQPFTAMVTTIPAIALGHIARGQIKRTGDDGRSMATWGMALGWAGLAASVVFILAVLALIVVVARSAHGS
jgi:Domain of unknown function (DUF1707)/Domain of unknown function (DUF4190)